MSITVIDCGENAAPILSSRMFMRRDKDEVGPNDSARSPILSRSRMFSCRVCW